MRPPPGAGVVRQTVAAAATLLLVMASGATAARAATPYVPEAAGKDSGPAPPGTSRWSLQSEPPGAAILINGVNTGRRTPHTFVSRQGGVHRIVLRLRGHADEVKEFHQDPANLGLSYSTILTPSRQVQCQARMAADSARPSTAAARARTSRFLGPEEGWAGARVDVYRGASLGLTAVVLRVHGDGRVVLESYDGQAGVMRADTRLQLPPADARALLRRFVDEGFLGMVTCRDRPLVPDEVQQELTLVSPAGRRHALAKGVNHEHQRFDALYQLAQAIYARLDAATRKRLRL